MVEKARNVLYLMDYFYGTEGGTERQVFELIKGLDRKRYMPVMSVLQDTDFVRQADISCRKKILHVKSMTQPLMIIKMLDMAAEIYRSKIDLVHIFFNDAAIIAPLFCKLGGARVISSRRDMGFWYTPGKLKLLRLSNMFVDRIAVNSIAVKNGVSAHERFPESRIDVLYNGLDPDRFTASATDGFREHLGIGSGDAIVGMVSNLYPIKRPKDLISAVSVIHKCRPNVHLVFAGGGPREIDPLKEFAKKHGLNGKVHFLGRVKEIGPIIKHFDVGVLCSESEGLSNAIIEYMACSKPVVCTDVGGNAELVIQGVNGFLVETGNIEMISQGILNLCSNKDLRDRFGKNGRNLFLTGYTSDRMVREYMKLYDSLFNSKN